MQKKNIYISKGQKFVWDKVKTKKSEILETEDEGKSIAKEDEGYWKMMKKWQ